MPIVKTQDGKTYRVPECMLQYLDGPHGWLALRWLYRQGWFADDDPYKPELRESKPVKPKHKGKKQ